MKDINGSELKEYDVWEFNKVRYILRFLHNDWWFIREDYKGTEDDWIDAKHSNLGVILFNMSHWIYEFDHVPNLPQRQDSVVEQMFDLYKVANKLGYYDAADYIREVFIESNKK
jgi:hypothetical protein